MSRQSVASQATVAGEELDPRLVKIVRGLVKAFLHGYCPGNDSTPTIRSRSRSKIERASGSPPKKLSQKPLLLHDAGSSDRQPGAGDVVTHE
jgi:hypothetical protein